MNIDSLTITNLRCFESVRLDLDAGLNVFVGDNGAGKSSLLEAVYLLGRGSSFRQTPGRRLIRDTADALAVHARVQANDAIRSLGLQRDAQGTRASVNGNLSPSLLPILRAFPVLITEPGSHRLIEDGPGNRRKLLDWVVFHVEHNFLDRWREYSRALRQRNAALRQGDRRQAQVWTAPLVDAALQVNQMRERVAGRLAQSISEFSAELIATGQRLEVTYRPGWLSGGELVEVLERQFESDLSRGHTQSGPHRAELGFSVTRGSARDVLSRGQLKLLTAAIMLAQAVEVEHGSGRRPILLVDDFGAELGPSARERLQQALVSSGHQILLSVLEASALPSEADRMFHVKHETVARML